MVRNQHVLGAVLGVSPPIPGTLELESSGTVSASQLPASLSRRCAAGAQQPSLVLFAGRACGNYASGSVSGQAVGAGGSHFRRPLEGRRDLSPAERAGRGTAPSNPPRSAGRQAGMPVLRTHPRRPREVPHTGSTKHRKRLLCGLTKPAIVPRLRRLAASLAPRRSPHAQ